MLHTGKTFRLISWAIPLLAATTFAQVPGNRTVMPGGRLIRPLGRGTPVPVPNRLTAAPEGSSTPVAAVPMSQRPSNPPQISYQSGMLTIVADNSSLGDILREVHRTTGAVIDVPPNATERVVTRLGPGPARDVLADLLNGSAFNYVMTGSMTDPFSLASVVLTMKPAGGTGQTEAYQSTPTYIPPQSMVPAPGTGPGGPVVQQPANDEETDADTEEEKDEDDSGDEGQAADQAQSNGAAPAADGSQPNAGPKTPEQILEMLRQRQQNIPQGPGQQVVRPPMPSQPPQSQPPPDDNN